MPPVFSRVAPLALLALFSPTTVQAHGGETDAVGTRVDAAVSVTWRDEGVETPNGLWQLPGVLMGGEAFPVEAGTTLDDARVSLFHRTEHNVFGQLQVASHDGRHEAELHHAWVGADGRVGHVTWLGAAGRMSAAMTPANGEHSSDRWFSETPLPLDAFLGRQLNDDGLRLQATLGGWQLGVESWRGRAFPATADEEGGSLDAYLHYRHRSDALTWRAGVWWLQADALSRTDTRYDSDGHSHGTEQVVAPEYWFDGSTDMAGVFWRGQWQMGGDWGLNWDAQWIDVTTDGDLRDSTRQVQLAGDYNGGWVQTLVRKGTHHIGLRWERLALENHLTGAAADDVATLTGLNNPGFDPQRTTLLYYWQAKPSLAVRFEAVMDELQGDDLQRAAIGVVWRAPLLETQ